MASKRIRARTLPVFGTTGRRIIVPAPWPSLRCDMVREVGESIDTRIAAAWALVCRGRTARAARRRLLEVGDLDVILSLTPAEAAEIAQEPMESVRPLLEPDRIAGVDEQIRFLGAAHARLVGLLDDEYPPLLRQIPDPPV